MEICRAYGWTYREFLDTPSYFIDLILDMMAIDAAKAKANKQTP